MAPTEHTPRQPPFRRRWSRVYRRALLVSGVVVMSAASALAQAPAATNAAGATAAASASAAMAQVEGKTIEGASFKLSSLKGKVVLVMFWSTGCAVCRDKMPELRNNYEGWAGKPFELVAVNTDTRMQDFLDYERIISRTVPLKQRFVQLWTGDAGYKDNMGKPAQLPAAFLVDKTGKVVERYVGRIPPEAWDRIADLL
ncbi:MAG: TlpA disulfide reductase family protein [Polaromonas sp.]|uniref:peroxiredoxin family protein n=1 Tax=Polaromonas sp. TaxID=1869339 RepID=UPI00326789CD